MDRKRPEVPDGLTCYFWLQEGTTRQQDPEVTNSRVFVEFDAAETQLLTPDKWFESDRRRRDHHSPTEKAKQTLTSCDPVATYKKTP